MKLGTPLRVYSKEDLGCLVDVWHRASPGSLKEKTG